MDMKFSEKEQVLYDFIKTSTKENGVTAQEMQGELGEKVLGGIGKLLKAEVVERKKLKTTDEYNTKSVWHYKAVKEIE